MKPKIIKLEREASVNYPIGDNIANVTKTCADMAKQLKGIYPAKSTLKFYVRGSSGAIMGAIISTMIPECEIIICHVKKEGEDSHSGGQVSRCENIQAPSIIIDDFIITGSTIKAIYEAMGVEVDTLCVSGQVVRSELPFEPKHIICGSCII